ncbi:hypothetical protein ThidrDRAFT_3276 [Thiorhodococcus drewsii AZ1]|uniref:DUF2934 domain-containing protein n=1 Tax=Thiorhodococcus drewsii AZ1 TaxID=765913 RepID=G2E4R3_9GAMM|nr:DUF2934 domain-containing protein [Thiorhodococcus drewsii]EGV29539.1 hypothetical protein ThidrDRAFT_3276 [Thiorhodococcus drewsii AZ1]
MADEKIVTKKTAAKKPAPKKTAAKKVAVSQKGTASAAAKTKAVPSKPTATKPAEPKAKKASVSAAAKKTTVKKTAVAARTKSASVADNTQGHLKLLANPSEQQRLAMVQEAAYYKAEKRNFGPGHETEDWAEAEREIDELINRAKTMTGS